MNIIQTNFLMILCWLLVSGGLSVQAFPQWTYPGKICTNTHV